MLITIHNIPSSFAIFDPSLSLTKLILPKYKIAAINLNILKMEGGDKPAVVNALYFFIFLFFCFFVTICLCLFYFFSQKKTIKKNVG